MLGRTLIVTMLLLPLSASADVRADDAMCVDRAQGTAPATDGRVPSEPLRTIYRDCMAEKGYFGEPTHQLASRHFPDGLCLLRGSVSRASSYLSWLMGVIVAGGTWGFGQRFGPTQRSIDRPDLRGVTLMVLSTAVGMGAWMAFLVGIRAHLCG